MVQEPPKRVGMNCDGNQQQHRKELRYLVRQKWHLFLQSIITMLRHLLALAILTVSCSAWFAQLPHARNSPRRLTKRHVVTPPTQQPPRSYPEWYLDDDTSNQVLNEEGFYELQRGDLFTIPEDEQEEVQADLSDQPAQEVFLRDESDRLEEREDRMYVNQDGVQKKIERCVLVGVEDLGRKRNDDTYFTLEESLIEMRELVRTAGLDLQGEITQRMHSINPKTYIGTGKVKEALELLESLDCCTVVFDAELTPGQQKALENSLNKNLLQNDFLVQDREIKVVDRTALILDIFAQHARTREGKLQVDLALHEYRKPRLTRMWTHLERQSGAGGVGLRGPGESQLEIDKRLVRDRIIVLKKKIDDVQKQRDIHRKGRERTGLPLLALVGYTNAGKSSLLNALTKSGVLAESMLFATLDPTTRKVKLPGLKTHPEVLLTDTVGFIQKLPTNLVAAFRATLEEVRQADVLVHVIDIANPAWEKQEASVKSVLDELGVGDKPIVRVLNKVDLLSPEEGEQRIMEAASTKNSVVTSASLGDGLPDFVAVVEEAMSELMVAIEVILPFQAGKELSALHEQGNVEVVDYTAEGTYVKALVPTAMASRLAKYSVGGSTSKQQKKKKRNEWEAIGRGRHEK